MKKFNTSIIALAGITLAASISQAQIPGSILEAAGQVNGSVTVSNTSPGGCPTRVCTTNDVTFSRCFTNTYLQQVCITNASGVVQCSNVPVTIVRCFTNTFPEISCTNEFLTPTSLTVHEALTGDLIESACDQVFGLFPSNAVFQAALSLNVRTNDWVGTQFGFFKIVSGTNVLATGTMSGVNGVPCGQCNHFEGTLHGIVLTSGSLHGASLQADYAASLTDVSNCPSALVPQGKVVLVINGVTVVPCFSAVGTRPLF